MEQVNDIVAPFAHDNAGGKIGPTLARHNARLPAALRDGSGGPRRGDQVEEDARRKEGARARMGKKFARQGQGGDVPRGKRFDAWMADRTVGRTLHDDEPEELHPKPVPARERSDKKTRAQSAGRLRQAAADGKQHLSPEEMGEIKHLHQASSPLTDILNGGLRLREHGVKGRTLFCCC